MILAYIDTDLQAHIHIYFIIDGEMRKNLKIPYEKEIISSVGKVHSLSKCGKNEAPSKSDTLPFISFQ